MKLFLKNKKYTFMIIFFIFCFCCISRVDALVLKNVVDINTNDSLTSGTLTTGSLNYFGRTDFVTPLNANDYSYDLIVFKLLRFNFTTTYNYQDNSVNYYCNSFNINSTSSSSGGDQEYYYYNMTCNSTSSSGTNVDTLVKGEITINGTLYSDQGSSGCWIDSSLGNNYFVCPIYKDHTYSHFMINATTNGYDSVSYNVQYSVQKLFYNYDSTEVVNALSQVQQQQVNTVTTIENFNNYVSNNNTSSSQTQSTTALSGLTTSFNSHLNQMNELTRLAFMPINFILDIADSTCQPLVWEIPFVNQRVVVPCMSTIYNGYFSVVVGIFSTVMTSLITYRCCLKLFNTIKGVLDAEDDKIEVVDL